MLLHHGLAYSRSREGAWIEISSEDAYRKDSMNVAPARERGLKYKVETREKSTRLRRSREGAWIEITEKLL